MIKSLADHRDDFVTLHHVMMELSLLSGCPEISQTDPDYDRVFEEHERCVQECEARCDNLYIKLNNIFSDELIEAGLKFVEPEIYG